MSGDNVTRVAMTGEGVSPGSSSLPLVPSRMRVRGDEVGRYVIIERLGVGGMGEVYSAFDPELDRKVAIKLLVDARRATANTTGGAARLVREAQAMAKLVHPNVVAVHDVGTTDNQVFVAMEFVTGGDLRGWMDAGTHPWREVLRRFLGAARGLAAAHRAGLVHRDFKPENVLITDHGVLKVADFGLARRAGELPPELPPADERVVTDVGQGADAPALDVTPDVDGQSVSRSRNTPVTDRLTVTGGRMGTPGYMAPEQWLGEEVGPAADQFAFCVALYEALYGERPHRGESANAQMFQVTEEKILDAPRGTKVPSWLRRIVLRGLKSTPRERWPSMDALIAELERTPVRRGRNFTLAAVGGLALVVGAVVVTRPDAEPSLCQGSERELAEVWSPEVRTEVEAAFESVGVAYADATLATVTRRLDDYAAGWVRAHAEACKATRVRGVETEAVLTRRMACLADRRRQLDGVAGMMRQADGEVVRRAVALVETLPAVDSCLDRALLEQEIPAPADPDAAVLAEELEGRLDESRRLRVAGDYEAAVEVAKSAYDAAVGLNYPPLTAHARFTLGSALCQLEASTEEGERQLEQTMVDAMALGDDRLFARAASHLGASQGAYAEGNQRDLVFELGFAAVERLGSAQELRASLAMNYGRSLRRRGEHDAAQAQYERALADYKAVFGDDHIYVGDALFNMGATNFAAGKYDLAREQTTRAREIWATQVGAQHPRAVKALSSLAAFEYISGHYDASAKLFEEQLELTEQLHGPQSAEVADILSNLGGVYRHLDQLGRAKESLERAVRLREAKFGPDSLWVGQALANLAPIEFELGEHERALATAERAFGIIQAVRGAEHAEMATMHLIRAEILLGLDEPERALVDLRRGRVLLLGEHGSDHNAVLETDRMLADAHLALGKPELALEVIGPVVADGGVRMESEHGRAQAFFIHARALREVGRDDEAIAAASKADALYAALASPIEDEHAEVKAFLADG